MIYILVAVLTKNRRLYWLHNSKARVKSIIMVSWSLTDIYLISIRSFFLHCCIYWVVTHCWFLFPTFSANRPLLQPNKPLRRQVSMKQRKAVVLFSLPSLPYVLFLTLIRSALRAMLLLDRPFMVSAFSEQHQLLGSNFIISSLSL
jgi:hypothetical protein